MTRSRFLAAGAACPADPRARVSRSTRKGAKPVRVRVQTTLGDIVLELDPAKAPGTTANFLKYVDGGHYDGGTFHRTVKMDNQPESPIKIEVIQAGVNAAKAKDGFPAIPLERTSVTGLKHVDGAVSMARGTADSATSGWFICINDQPSLDFGGQRNPDGQGFAAFGRVVSGMDVVRKIQQAPSSADRTTNTEAQKLTPPITVTKVVAGPVSRTAAIVIVGRAGRRHAGVRRAAAAGRADRRRRRRPGRGPAALDHRDDRRVAGGGPGPAHRLPAAATDRRGGSRPPTGR